MNKTRLFITFLLLFMSFFTAACAAVPKPDSVKVDLFTNVSSREFFRAFIVLNAIKKRLNSAMELKITCLLRNTPQGFEALNGNDATQECKRIVVMENLYPDRLYNYLDARILNPSPDGWRDALSFAGIEYSKFKRQLKKHSENFLRDDFEYAKSKNISDFSILIDDVPCFERLRLMPMLAKINDSIAKDKRIYIPSPSASSLREIKMYIIESKEKAGMEDKHLTGNLRNLLGGSVAISKIAYSRAKKMSKFRKLKLDFLPCYVIEKDKHTEKALDFAVKSRILKKGKKFFTVNRNNIERGILVNEKTQKNKLVLFTMTQCPYGVIAENALLDALEKKLLPENLKLDIKYIVTVKAGKNGSYSFSSMHGTGEWEEAVRQMLIKKYYPSKFWKYLSLRNEDISSSRWHKAAETAGIDLELIESKFETGKKMLKENSDYANGLGINSSPTFLWQGREIIMGLGNLQKIDTFKNINTKGKPRGACG